MTERRDERPETLVVPMPAASCATPHQGWESVARTRSSITVPALVTALMYFLAAELGEWLAFPAAPVSAFWAPNAILLAALILTPREHWWAYLLAVLPFHFAAQLPDLAFRQVLIQYVANGTESVLGAWALQRYCEQPRCFDRARTVFMLVGFAALLAPFVTSVLMAGAFAALDVSDEFWLIVSARTLTNAFAIIVLVPLIVHARERLRRGPREVPFDRLAEGAVLALSLTAVGIVVFVDPATTGQHLTGAAYVPLPFLVWAVMRFGTAGACAAALLLGGLSTWGVLNGHGPFVTGDPVHSALSVVTFQVFVAALLLVFASLMEERKAAAAAEDEARNQREQLAHLGRVAVLGQLSSAFAHELNQPLTSIMGNAEAGLRMLSSGVTDREELESILRDILHDDERASQVIQRLRSLLHKGETQRSPMNLNAVVQEVLELARSELLTRNVCVTTDFEAQLQLVSGDRVQVQQVVLNLLMNACDAMGDVPPLQRKLTLTTRSQAGGTSIELAVEDSGCGIPAGEAERIFKPFVTTKPLGMGLGLAICRSVAQAHHGLLWAENRSGGGAVFRLRLPTDGGRPS
jgi:signal transduction histidine kinase